MVSMKEEPTGDAWRSSGITLPTNPAN